MKILFLPGVLRQMATTVGIWAPVFFIVLIPGLQSVYDDEWYFLLSRYAVLSVFMAIHFWWFIAANDQDIQRNRFLVSLPLSRRQVARLGIQMMLMSQSVVIGMIALVCLGFLLLSLIDINQALFIAIYCLWFPLFTLLAYCLNAYVRFSLFRLLILMVSLMIPIGSMIGLAEDGLRGGHDIFASLAVPIIVAIISLLIIRHSERRFLHMDLL